MLCKYLPESLLNHLATDGYDDYDKKSSKEKQQYLLKMADPILMIMAFLSCRIEDMKKVVGKSDSAKFYKWLHDLVDSLNDYQYVLNTFQPSSVIENAVIDRGNKTKIAAVKAVLHQTIRTRTGKRSHQADILPLPLHQQVDIFLRIRKGAVDKQTTNLVYNAIADVATNELRRENDQMKEKIGVLKKQLNSTRTQLTEASTRLYNLKTTEREQTLTLSSFHEKHVPADGDCIGHCLRLMTNDNSSTLDWREKLNRWATEQSVEYDLYSTISCTFNYLTQDVFFVVANRYDRIFLVLDDDYFLASYHPGNKVFRTKVRTDAELIASISACGSTQFIRLSGEEELSHATLFERQPEMEDIDLD